MVDPLIVFHIWFALACGEVILPPALYHGLQLQSDLPRKPLSALYFTLRQYVMSKKTTKKASKAKISAEKRELAMIEGILEGSPDGIGVVVVRLDCGCRKMAAVDKNGDPASKIIMYRDMSESICAKCKQDNGAFVRVTESFIHWVDPAPNEEDQQMIWDKVIGTPTSH